ncbi:MAG: hypothetical protein EA363_02295 [Balneolaceae bacterium]|nr:MAG: hypothetical protein EA363_02295 [Balneolaceae bacterium]
MIAYVLLLASCSGKNQLYFSEDVDLSAGDPVFSILIAEADALQSDFPDHLFSSLSHFERRVLNERLPQYIQQAAGVEVTGFLDKRVFQDNEFDLRTFDVRNRSIEMISPVSGTKLTDEKSDSRFVLILDQLSFTPFAVEVGGGTYAGHENRVEQRLKLEMNYLIWDNVSGEAAGWGNLDITNSFDSLDQNASYTAILQEAFGKIMMSTPFS